MSATGTAVNCGAAHGVRTLPSEESRLRAVLPTSIQPASVALPDAVELSQSVSHWPGAGLDGQKVWPACAPEGQGLRGSSQAQPLVLPPWSLYQ